MSTRNILSAVCTRGGVFRFISQYLGSMADLTFNADVFDQLYNDFEAYHVSDLTPFTSTIPLLGFSSEEDYLEFDENTRIVRLDRSELNTLAGRHYFRSVTLDEFGLDTVKKVFASGFAIKTTDQVNKGQPMTLNIDPEKARDIVTALRLVKPGGVCYNIAFSGPSGFHPHAGLGAGSTAPLLPYPKGGTLHLSAQDTEVCKHIWQNLRRLSCQGRQGGLHVALRKFNDIYNRRLLEDKIIDMSILLESTLLHDESHGELGYKLSLRGAYLLKSTRDPVDTFNLLREFYRLRSRIVHAGKTLDSSIPVNDEELPPPDFVGKMESVCREVLRAFVEKVATAGSMGAVINSLNAQIVSAIRN